MRKALLPVLLALAAAPAVAALQDRPAQNPTRDDVCNFSGWSGDRDPAGLNVRAGPSTSAAIVGRLPPPQHDPDFEGPFAVEFDVVEARDGWFRIGNARRWASGERPAEALPSGWISGQLLDFALQTDLAFATPDPASPVVASAWRDADGGTHPLRYRHASACRGEWVRLLVAGSDGREVTGWVRGVCGIQETTCDGVRGDLVAHEDLPVR